MSDTHYNASDSSLRRAWHRDRLIATLGTEITVTNRGYLVHEGNFIISWDDAFEVLFDPKKRAAIMLKIRRSRT